MPSFITAVRKDGTSARHALSAQSDSNVGWLRSRAGIIENHRSKPMGSYVDEVLIKDEQVIYRGHLTLWGFFWWILGGLLLLPAFGLGLLVWLWAWLLFRSTELAVTNKRIIVK